MSSYKDMTKLLDERQKTKVICKCGHRIAIGTKRDRIICSWCKNYVFKNKEAEFKYRMKEQMMKERRK